MNAADIRRRGNAARLGGQSAGLPGNRCGRFEVAYVRGRAKQSTNAAPANGISEPQSQALAETIWHDITFW